MRVSLERKTNGVYDRKYSVFLTVDNAMNDVKFAFRWQTIEFTNVFNFQNITKGIKPM